MGHALSGNRHGPINDFQAARYRPHMSPHFLPLGTFDAYADSSAAMHVKGAGFPVVGGQRHGAIMHAMGLNL
jgi:hypothetical protein